MNSLRRSTGFGKKTAVFLLLLLFGLSPALASTSSQTVKALRAIENNRWEEGERLIAATHDPLAAKIYFWLALSRDGLPENYGQLTQFIRANPDWPGMDALKLKAEQAMPTDMSSAGVIAWYKDFPPQSAKGFDRYLTALRTSGQEPKARELLADWWREATLSRDEQKDIYKRHGMLINRGAHERRLDQLLFTGQNQNARAIAALLGQGYSAMTEARIALADNRSDAEARLRTVPESLQKNPGLMYERLRWRRKHDLDAAALTILRSMPPLETIANPEDWWKERHIMIRRLMEHRQFKDAYALARAHGQIDGPSYAEAEWLAGWLSLRFLDNPPRAYEHFENMFERVNTPISRARGAYWAAQAAQVMKADALAQTWLRNAAPYQTVYYGQLAGARLGLEQALSHAAPPKLSDADKQSYKSDELIRAAQIFNDVGQAGRSGRFLQAFIARNKDPKAYRFAAELAAEMGQYKQTIQIAKKATQEGLFLTLQSYPVIADHLRQVPVEWALVHALIRQESQFDPEARSPAGALGLMQLMPATAREVGRKIGVVSTPAALTQNPQANIRLGSAYLQRLLKKYDNAYPLAIAAYNAGPARVDEWLVTFGDPRRGRVDWIDWVEMIPIYETRNYVQRVMEGVYVYRLRLKNIQKKPQEPIHVAYAGPYAESEAQRPLKN